MSATLKIVVMVDPEIPVPPSHYGGIERIVHFLVEGLAARGHDVRLFANAHSSAAVRVIPYPRGRSGPFGDTTANALVIRKEVAQRPPDVIHNFGRLAYLAALVGSRIPMIQSYQRHVTRNRALLGSVLFGDRLSFTACSRSCALSSGFSTEKFAVVYNGVRLGAYRFVSEVAGDAPLVFLGRIERIKGAHTAIAVARAAGRKIVVLGNRVETREGKAYFETEIAPRLNGDARFVGPVDDVQKNEWLGRAAALLFPIEWEEPFGIVMAEALACGTPVIAFRRGSVPEVVEDGKTGFICGDAAEMTAAVGRLSMISRSECRESAENRFSDRVIISDYERLYHEKIERNSR